MTSTSQECIDLSWTAQDFEREQTPTSNKDAKNSRKCGGNIWI